MLHLTSCYIKPINFFVLGTILYFILKIAKNRHDQFLHQALHSYKLPFYDRQLPFHLPLLKQRENRSFRHKIEILTPRECYTVTGPK